jgi:glycosyltransferase involved in cell wall biosynthesis
MNTWVYTVAYNEQDLLPFWLRHYSAISSKIIVYDHGSTDDTRKIAKQNPLVELRDYEVNPQMDDDSWTAFVNVQYKEAVGQADWIIWCDVDEFVMTTPGKLHTLLNYGVTLPETAGYTMICDGFPENDYRQIYETCKTGVPDALYSKRAIFHPEVNINYSPGKHRCFPTGPVTNSCFSEPIKLLHYRYFGPEWLAARNAKNYARLSERNKAKGQGVHVFPNYNQGLYSQAWYAAQSPEVVI